MASELDREVDRRRADLEADRQRQRDDAVRQAQLERDESARLSRLTSEFLKRMSAAGNPGLTTLYVAGNPLGDYYDVWTFGRLALRPNGQWLARRDPRKLEGVRWVWTTAPWQSTDELVTSFAWALAEHGA